VKSGKNFLFPFFFPLTPRFERHPPCSFPPSDPRTSQPLLFFCSSPLQRKLQVLFPIFPSPFSSFQILIQRSARETFSIFPGAFPQLSPFFLRTGDPGALYASKSKTLLPSNSYPLMSRRICLLPGLYFLLTFSALLPLPLLTVLALFGDVGSPGFSRMPHRPRGFPKITNFRFLSSPCRFLRTSPVSPA